MTKAFLKQFDLKQDKSEIRVTRDLGEIRDLAKTHTVFPLRLAAINGRRKLLLLMADVEDLNVIDDVEFRTGVSVVPIQAWATDILQLIATYPHLTKKPPHSDSSF